MIAKVWRSRCAVTSRKFGAKATLVLTRWDPEQPPSPYNLVLLMTTELDKMVGCKVKSKQKNSKLNANDEEIKDKANGNVNDGDDGDENANSDKHTLSSTDGHSIHAATAGGTVNSTTAHDSRQQSISPTKEHKLMKAQSVGRLLPGFSPPTPPAAAAAAVLPQHTSSPATITNTTTTSSSSSSMNAVVFTEQEARQGRRSHLSAETIARITARLAWAKELYTRTDYDYSLPSPSRTYTQTQSKHTRTMYGDTSTSITSVIYDAEGITDLSKGFIAGALFTAVIATMTFAVLHRKT